MPRSVVCLVLALFWAHCAPVEALNTPTFALGGDAGWTLQEGGLLRRFELATDQVQLRDGRGGTGLQFLPPGTGAAGVVDEVRRRLAAGEDACLVLYEVGRPRSSLTRRTLTRDVVVHLASDVAPASVFAGLSLEGAPEALEFAPGFHRACSRDPDGAPGLCRELQQRAGVLGAEVQLARVRSLRRIPNDALFLWQWHLRTTVTNTVVLRPVDIQVAPVWDQFRGSGITLGIIDSGIQSSHPDLSPNLVTSLGWDFIGKDANANPSDYARELHGTAVAGVAAARGDNGIGVAGVAYEARIAPMRLVTGAGFTDDQAAAAFARSNSVIQIKNNSWGVALGGTDLSGVGDVVESTLAESVATGRGGLGTVHVFAAGNEAELFGDVNYDALDNSIYVIPVAATAQDGVAEYYSNAGAALVVAAPVGAPSGWNTVTTDLTGVSQGYNRTGTGMDLTNPDYTGRFLGTSAAAPMVSGAIALMLQANPNLGWRDVQEILMRSATLNDPGSSGWAVNSGGLHFHHRYGGGLLNVSNAVALARAWNNLPPTTNQIVGAYALNTPIPDNATDLTIPLALLDNNLRVEHVRLRLDVDHPSRGQLQITLTSPHGMVSRLAEERYDTNGNYKGWVFTSRAHWTEHSRGTWLLTVRDVRAGLAGTLLSTRLEVLGTPADALRLEGTTLAESASASNGNGYPDPGETLHVAAVFRNISTQTVSSATVTLISPTPGVTVTRSLSALPDLPRGGLATNLDAFGVRLAKTLPCGTPLEFLMVTRGNGLDLTNRFIHQTGKTLDGPAVTNDLASTDVPKTIPDIMTAYSKLIVPELPNHVLDTLEVRVRLDHTAVGDLQLGLKHPGGQEIILASNVGGNEPNFGTGSCSSGVPTVFDDRATAAIARGSAPFASRFQPAEPLSRFVGLPLAGTWTLRVSDVYDEDAGTLLCWSMRAISHERTYACETFSTVPTANSAHLEVVEGTSVSGKVAGSDADADPVTVGLLSLPAHGRLTGPHPITGLFTYSPVSGYRGPDSFTFYATDGFNRSQPAVVSITVQASSLDTLLHRPSFTSETGFTLSVEGLPGTQYYFEATTNFVQWELLATNTPIVSPFQLADPQATQHPFRFYRLKR